MRHSIYYGQDNGSIYTNEGKIRLWKEENIIYFGGFFAFKLTKRTDLDEGEISSPLVTMYYEDDGQLSTGDNPVQFDSVCLGELYMLTHHTLGIIESEVV
jgi:hypothetical protein